MEKLFAKAKQAADQVEVLCVQRQRTSLSNYFYQAMEVLDQDLTEVSLRVIKDGKIGFVAGSLDNNVDALVAAAVQAAACGPQATFSFPAQQPDGGGQIYDQQLADMSVADLSEQAAKILAKTRQAAPAMPLNLYMERDRKTVSILNTSGRQASYTTTVYTITLLHMFEKSKEGINKELVACQYFEFPDEKIDELVAEYHLVHHQPIKVKTGKYPVIFRPSATWSLLYRILAGTNGQNIVKGISPLKEKIGQRILPETITFMDDPTKPWAPGSVPFDDEGVATIKKPIIEKGVLRNFIYDLEAAARGETTSSGNGFKHSMFEKSIELPPTPRFTNLVMSPGSWEYQDMIKDMRTGIIVNDVIGFHSGNLLRGEFSMGVGMGFVVEEGQIKGRAMDAMVAGNIYEDFDHIKGLGSQIEYNSLGYTPAIYFQELSVAGS